MTAVPLRGDLSVRAIPTMRRSPITSVDDALRASDPRQALSIAAAAFRFRNRRSASFKRSIDAVAEFEELSKTDRTLSMLGSLFLSRVRANGKVDDLGLAGCRVITNAGAGFFVDAMQGLVDVGQMRFHGVGTGTAAEAASNTALTTELTTQYASSNSRPQGTATEASGSANVFESSATITVSAAVSLTEHGIFNRAAVGGGVLLDRSVFPSVSLAASESLQATYQLTFTAGN